MEKVKIDELVKGAGRICITGHIRPDGDCTGSCLGLRRYLLDGDESRQVDVFLEPVPAIFQMLPGYDRTGMYSGGRYDVCFVLDVSDLQRLGENAACLENSDRVICIDHHVTNTGFAAEAFVKPDAAATCELLFEMMDEERISSETAKCLYLGIVHDTGVFKHSNTTRHTMEVAGALMEKGIAHDRLINDTFYAKTYLQNQLLGRALMESILFCDGRCIVSMISGRSMEFYKASHEDLEGIVDQLRVTVGVDCAIFMTEIEFRVYKVSLRSNEKVDVSRVASYFGGGGHVRAAGCTMSGTFYDVVNNLSAQIAGQLDP
ncbi:MAG: bifunctional oligoribonuclease/PAP phosphatase NrnA [Lachnospiraceae bacterium]|nr:bifunctional oligoribonuclease/PAP phosphatase NrnA [Lachnospiraceae bacterium]